MLFLIFSNANLRFAKKELIWTAYSATKALLTIQKLEIIGKNEFVTAALDEKDKNFVLHKAATNIKTALNVNLSWHEAQIALLEIEKIKIPSQYVDYTDVILPDSTAELPSIPASKIFPSIW